MTASDVARVLSVLARSDDEALEFFHVRARTSEATPVETLRWWRRLMVEVTERLVAGDTAALEAYRDAIESARQRRARPQSPTAPEVASASGVGQPPQVGSMLEAAGRAPLAEPPPPASPPSPLWARGPSGEPSPWGAPRPSPSGPAADETDFMTPVDVSEARRKLVMPFSGEGSALPPPVQIEPRDQIGGTAKSGEDAEETAFMSAVDERKARQRPATPFAGEPPGAGGSGANDQAEAAVDRHAALVALTEHATPEQRARAHRRYGLLDEAARRALDGELEALLAARPTLHARFERSLTVWRAWLAANPNRREGT